MVELPEWVVIAGLMDRLHKTEREIYEGVSPAMIARLQFLDDSRETKRNMDNAMEEALAKQNGGGGVSPKVPMRMRR